MISAIDFAKNIARPTCNFIHEKLLEVKLANLIRNRSEIEVDSFDFDKFKNRILKFVRLMKCDMSPFAYHYSASSTEPTLYSSAYACMTLGLLGELDKLGVDKKIAWNEYFDSFQSPQDGLFYDPTVQNEIFNDTDWWGARHLALHMISAYTDLGARPRYMFKFLEEYYFPGTISRWLDNFDWHGISLGAGDVDNKIMNIGGLLQYQRDYWDDIRASTAVEELKFYLRKKINETNGIWGCDDLGDSRQRSRMVQFAYHIFPIFFYDGDYSFDFIKITPIVLATQNAYGGYGVMPNSSACEDIDSLDLLLNFIPKLDQKLKTAAMLSIKRGLNWVLLNQMNDGGFVFRLFSKFVYGHDQMHSVSNHGAFFPTWFRLLSISNILRSECNWPVPRKKTPGYYFF